MTGFANSPSGSAQPTGPRRPRWTRRTVVPAAAALAFAGTLTLVACGPVSPLTTGHPVAAPTGVATQPVDFTTTPNLTSAVQNVVPGIVDIDTTLGMQNGEAAGTGIVLSSDGTVLTNNHVVEGATQISVTDLGNGQTYPASVVGYDRTDDLAVIKLSGASGLQTAPLGNSDQVTVGDTVVGVGNAGGQGTPTAASGRVTALNQAITASDDSSGSSEQLTGLIQVSANIQPGDSGGPLVNSSGQVVGMDTAATKGFRFGRGGNQGFAIPINKAQSIAQNIENGSGGGNIHLGDSAFLGVSVSDAQNGQGALVRGVVNGGPADSLGLTQNSVITAVNGTNVTSATDLTNTMDQFHPGDSVTIHWVDGSGQSQSQSVTLAKGPVG